MTESQAELKSRILKLLREDQEFRYAVAGLLGLEELLARLDKHEKVLEELLGEIKSLREEQGKLREDFNRMREDFLKMLERIVKLEEEENSLQREVKRLEASLERLRGDMLYGFSQLSKFAGLTFETFVRDLLTRSLRESGVLPPDKELRSEVVGGEEVDIFCDAPLIVGEVTAHAESEEELYKLLRKAEAAEEALGRPSFKRILVVLTAPRRVAEKLRELSLEHDVELIIGKVME